VLDIGQVVELGQLMAMSAPPRCWPCCTQSTSRAWRWCAVGYWRHKVKLKLRQHDGEAHLRRFLIFDRPVAPSLHTVPVPCRIKLSRQNPAAPWPTFWATWPTSHTHAVHKMRSFPSHVAHNVVSLCVCVGWLTDLATRILCKNSKPSDMPFVRGRLGWAQRALLY